MQRNSKLDCLVPAAQQRWSDDFLAKSPVDNYNTPKSAPEEWWNGIKVNSIDIFAGEAELLFDDIVEFGASLKVCLYSHPRFTC
jgi:hypothetical protein